MSWCLVMQNFLYIGFSTETTSPLKSPFSLSFSKQRLAQWLVVKQFSAAVTFCQMCYNTEFLCQRFDHYFIIVI